MSTAIAYDPSESDVKRSGKPGTQTATAPKAPPTKASEDEKHSSSTTTELRRLEDRPREIKSGMGSVNKFHDLHKYIAEDTAPSDKDGQMTIQNGGQKTEHREALKITGHTEENDHMERISVDAFMRGQRLKVIQKEWDEYLFPEYLPEEIPLIPIEVVSGEPDPRIILQIASSGMRNIEGSLTKRFHVERVPQAREAGELSEQQPLPERIRIRSKPLIIILDEIDIKSFTTLQIPSDTNFVIDSEVFLRPYQEFIYREQQLRDWLDILEKRFENYHGTKRSSSLPHGVQEDPSTRQEHVEDLVKTQSGSNTVQLDEDVPEEQNEKINDGSVGSTGPTGGHEHILIEEQPELYGSHTYRLPHSIPALLHLRCLMKFIDTEIKPKQNYINSPSCTRIYFHDLWHLFKPGDEVIQQNQKQAFVVLRVQVPRHRTEDPYHRWHRVVGDNGSDSSVDSITHGDDDQLFRIHCAYIDFDGKYFGPVAKMFKIAPFDGLKPIKFLPVLPLRCHPYTYARQMLISRGMRLLKVSPFKAAFHTGVTLDGREEIDSPVVIDFQEALADERRRNAWEPTIGTINVLGDRMGPRCNAICCEYRNVHDGSEIDGKMTEDYLKSLFPDTSRGVPSLILQPRSSDEVLSSPERLTETELLIMTYRVFGFILRSRKWAQLDLDMVHLNNAKPYAYSDADEILDHLVLPPHHREVLTSLVVQHFRSKPSMFMKNGQTDLIQAKGKGLIMLLHGPPGVGKTATADAIARIFGRPLFHMTCGDLGTTAREVEEELEKNFSLASRWGCILLLDEADVFLSAREHTDLNHNGLVAVFLRVLEYFSGILFLTTTKTGDFDEAFLSRLHMKLYFPPLNEESTWKAFKLNLALIKERMVRQGRSITFDQWAIENFARNHFLDHVFNRWNGHQIRNACQTALALADFDSQGGSLQIDAEIDNNAVVQLQLRHFETVQKAYFNFSEYLGDVQGTQSDSRAIDQKLRARKDTP